MYNDLIKLISVTTTTDEVGDTVEVKTENEVFAEKKSIGQSEFYQAQTVGLKPEIKFVLSDYYDYSDEQTIIHDGKEFRVLRTYRTGNELEIVCVGDVHVSS